LHIAEINNILYPYI